MKKFSLLTLAIAFASAQAETTTTLYDVSFTPKGTVTTTPSAKTENTNKLYGSLTLSPNTQSIHPVEITIAYDSDPISLDPMQQLSADTIQMGNTLFDPLVRYDSKLNITPRLAKSWEQLNPTTMRFHLRQGVKFSSGNPLTADDVVFSFNRAKTSANFRSITAPFDKMEKVDDYTVDLVAKKPYPLTLQMMTNIFIMDSKFYSGKDENGQDKRLVDTSGNTFASTHVSGSGAFRLESRQQGVKTVYVKNPDYWAETGNVDKITLVPIKENATRLAALKSGDVDWINPVPPADIESLKTDGKFTLHSIPSNRIIFLFLDQNVAPELKDPRVRKAIDLAINNSGIVEKIMRGSATAAGQFAPAAFTGRGHDPALKPRYDLEQAKQLMKEAGLEKGFTTTMIAPNNRYINDEKIAQSVAAMLAKIGIKVQLSTMPKAQYFPERDKCQAGIALMGISPIANDAIDYSSYDVQTHNPEKGVGQYNCSYSNPKLDALLEQAANEMDSDKRNALLQQVAQLEYDDVPVAMLHWQNLNWAYQPSFKNFPDIVNMSNIPKWDELEVKE